MNTFPPPPALPLSGPAEASSTIPILQPPPLPPEQDVPAGSMRPEGRDARGRFTAGNSGRPKGARSRLITELEQAMELGAPEIVRILIARAHDGSMEAAKYVLERVAPSRRGRLVEIEGFPAIKAPADVPDALASLATAVGNGTVTVEEATALGGLLQRFLDTYETAHRLGKTFIE
jgi:hypothetical protein